MSDINNDPPYTNNLQEHLLQVRRLLARHALAEAESQAQERPPTEHNGLVAKLLHKRQSWELREKMAALHSAEIACILDTLNIQQRLLVWDLVKADRGGEILIRVSDAVREGLVAPMSREELLIMTRTLPVHKLAELTSCLPQAVMREVFKSLSLNDREQLRAAMSHPKNEVGSRIEFDVVTIRENVTLEVVSRYLRLFNKLPDHTDPIFVIDRDGLFKGLLPLSALLVNKPQTPVSSLMVTKSFKLHPEDNFDDAARSFKRFALISVPVVDEDGKLVGRISVSKVLDYMQARSNSEFLKRTGLRKEEDIFSSVWKSVQNRGLWLALYLSAFIIAARVISGFESSIGKLLALAVLMPIVPAFASHSANQTSALMQRTLASGSTSPLYLKRFILKEVSIAGLNGLVWGGMAGAFAYVLYKNALLSLTTTGSVLLSLLLGSLAGILIPLGLKRFGRDTSSGGALLLTVVTYSGGFFLFLGLATLILIPS